MGPCMSFDQLARLLDEQLDDRQQEAVEDHVEGCPTCQQRLEELAVARNERGPSSPSRRRILVQAASRPASCDPSRTRARPRQPGPPTRTRSASAGRAGRLLRRRNGATVRAAAIADDRGLPDRPRDRPRRHGGRLRGDRAGPGPPIGAEDPARRTRPRRPRSSGSTARRCAAAKLHHTNIVPVFGVGEDEGQLYYVMQFIESESLGQVFDGSHRDDDGTPDASARTTLRSRRVELGDTLDDGSNAVYFRTIARIGRQVAEALAYAHDAGHTPPRHQARQPPARRPGKRLGHRFRPGQGVREGRRTDPDRRIVGTVRYMAPERFDGRSEPRSDVYALGVTLYELLTLRPLFAESRPPKLIERILHDEPVPPRQLDRRIPRDLETIVQKAMAKEPEARYASAAAMAEDLRRFLGDEPVLARPIGLGRAVGAVVPQAAEIGGGRSAWPAASLMLATGLSIALAWSQYRAASRLRTEQALTLSQKTRAEENCPGCPASGRRLPHQSQRRDPVEPTGLE